MTTDPPPSTPTPPDPASSSESPAGAIPDLSPWFRTLRDLPAPCAWTDVFPRPQPVEIDVGCGRGLFLYRASERHPDINYLGIEIEFKEARRGALRLKKVQRDNARVLGGDVRLALANYLPADSVQAVHVYFPDPWWKSKHHKRRLFNEDFVDRVSQLLVNEGELHLWTDVTDYFHRSLEVLAARPQFVALTPPDEQTPEHDMDYQTSFERKKRRDGWPIYRGRWQLRRSHSVSPPQAVLTAPSADG